jgi:hypothetical protein
MKIKKYSGLVEEFDENKLIESLMLTGVSKKIANDVVSEIIPKIKPGMTTNRVHTLAFNTLRKRSKVHAANYRIKRSILELGPSGYPFEILCSELFKAKGFETEVGVIVKCKHVKHEVDVIAVRPDMTIMAECKFHNSKSHKNDIKTALYIHARSLDIKNNKNSRDFDKFAICTNTHFSGDAVTYANGVGMILLSLNKDPQYSMIGNIIRYKVYPITCLKTLKKRVISMLLERKIVVIKQLEDHIEMLREFDYSDSDIRSVRKEIQRLRQ